MCPAAGLGGGSSWRDSGISCQGCQGLIVAPGGTFWVRMTGWDRTGGWVGKGCRHLALPSLPYYGVSGSVSGSGSALTSALCTHTCTVCIPLPRARPCCCPSPPWGKRLSRPCSRRAAVRGPYLTCPYLPPRYPTVRRRSPRNPDPYNPLHCPPSCCQD